MSENVPSGNPDLSLTENVPSTESEHQTPEFSQKQGRLRHSRKRIWVKRAFITLFVMSAIVWFLGFTRIGAQWTLSTVLYWVADESEVVVQKGSFADGLEIEKVALQVGSVHIALEQLHFALRWSTLWESQSDWDRQRQSFLLHAEHDPPPKEPKGYVLYAQTLSARSLAIEVKDSESEPDTPPWEWSMPDLPFSIAIPNLYLDVLEIHTATYQPVLSIQKAHASGISSGDRYYVTFHQLGLKTFGADTRIDHFKGYVSNHIDQPIAVQANVSGKYDQVPLQGTIGLHGKLTHLGVGVQGTVNEPADQFLAEFVYHHGQSLPLSAVQIELNHINPSRWNTDLPQADMRVHVAMSPTTCTGDITQSLYHACGEILIENNKNTAGGFSQQKLPVVQLSTNIQLQTDANQNWSVLLQDFSVSDFTGGQIQSSRIAFSGDSFTAVPRTQGRIDLQRLNIQHWASSAPRTALRGQISFDVNSLQDTHMRFQLFDQIQGQQASIQGTADIRKDSVQLSELLLSLGATRLQAQANYAWSGNQAFSAHIRTQDFQLRHWVNAGLPDSRLSLQAQVNGNVQPQLAVNWSASIDPSSHWNQHPLQAQLKGAWEQSGRLQAQGDIQLGANSMQVKGAMGGAKDALTAVLRVESLADFFPNWKGQLQGQLRIRGAWQLPTFTLDMKSKDVRLPSGYQWGIGNVTAAVNGWRPTDAISLDASIENMTQNGQLVLTSASAAIDGTMGKHRLIAEGGLAKNTLSQKPYAFSLVSDGSIQGQVGKWSTQQTITQFFAQYGANRAEFTSNWLLQAQYQLSNNQYTLDLGQGLLNVHAEQGHTIDISHAKTSIRPQLISTKGKVVGLNIYPDFLNTQYEKNIDRRKSNAVVLNGSWDLALSDALEGYFELVRTSGDMQLPQEPPLPIGLKELRLRVDARKIASRASQFSFQFLVNGENIGKMELNSEGAVRQSAQGWGLDPHRPFYASTHMSMKEVSWLSYFIGDAFVLGGQLNGDAIVRYDGANWTAKGDVDGQNLRFVFVDQGVRLLDGRLKLGLRNEIVQINELYFPSVIRVKPSDVNVRSWLDVAEHQKGFVRLSGDWNLRQHGGTLKTEIKHFPLVQRADRFIVASGNIVNTLTPNSLDMQGDVKMDVGWVNAATRNAAQLSDDVTVILPNATRRKSENSFQVRLALNADFGETFFVQGYGLYTGLKGKIAITTHPTAGLQGTGEVRTVDGRYRALGQELSIRRGVITFNGKLTDPSLSISAVRRNLPVTVGLRIGGTASRPLITLYSDPEMTDAEKLSWLVMGRGPDEAGTDIGFLVSAASSLLGTEGTGETITSRLGLDELGIRTGNINSTRGIIPENTVAGDSTSSATQAANEFFVIGKQLTDSLYWSYEQALAGQEGVVRFSYQLQERTSLVARFGTVNGLELIFRVFFDD